MSKGLVFWLLMVLWAVLVALGFWGPQQPGQSRTAGLSFGLLFVLLFILGWAVFGFVIQ